MQPHCVKLGVRPCLLFECKFWLEDDGWNATIELLGLTVYAPSFEAAKNDMELALGKHIELLLGDAWRAAADVLPETLQHRFPCEQYLRRLPNRIKDADPDFPISKQAKAEYAKLQ